MSSSRPLLTCRELIDFIGAYVDDALSAEERGDFEAHLALCPDCVNYLASYREIQRLGAALADDEAIPESVPEDLVVAVLRSRRT